MKVQLLSLPNCQQCKATARKMDQLGIDYEYIDMSEDAVATQKAKELGYLAAPVVIAGEDHWTGYRPDKILNLALICAL
jgi:glutaredoxin-like protein NrdH